MAFHCHQSISFRRNFSQNDTQETKKAVLFHRIRRAQTDGRIHLRSIAVPRQALPAAALFRQLRKRFFYIFIVTQGKNHVNQICSGIFHKLST